MYGRYWPLGKDKGSNDNDKVAPAILKILSLSGGRGEKKKRQISSHLYQLSWPADLGINSRFHKPLANIPPLYYTRSCFLPYAVNRGITLECCQRGAT